MSIVNIVCSCLRSSSVSSKIARSHVKEVSRKYKQVCDRKIVRKFLPGPSLLLSGSFVFKPDLSVTQLRADHHQTCVVVEPSDHRPHGGVVVWLVSCVRVLVHLVRTVLVFTPLVLLSPLALLPTSLRPSCLLLELLVCTLQTAGPAYIKLREAVNEKR